MSETSDNNQEALNGPIVGTFFKYLIPSLIGMLAMTSASIVDGIFIGNIVGTDALAAVNLIIPVMSLLFGAGLMLAIGGSVRAGKYLGEQNIDAASAVFSKTAVFVTLYGAVMITLGLVFERQIFATLGATEELFGLMSEYYQVLMPFLLAQLVTIVLYFFVKLDGFPTLTAIALSIGAVLNIALDYVFIALLQWELRGAAFATGISQLIPMLVLLSYFFSSKRRLKLSLRQKNWFEVFQSAYNGLSEFINEISAGLVAFIFNWMLLQRAGVDGVAAITVVNYLMMVGFMVFFAVSDSNQVMLSQNFGAGNTQRVKKFLGLGAILNLIISALAIVILLLGGETLIRFFIDEQGAEQTMDLALLFITYTWPVYLFAGINMLVSGYLTSLHLATQSAIVAVCRSLILPAILLLLFYQLFEGYLFIVALSVSELLTAFLAGFLFLVHRPSKAVKQAK